MSDIIKEEKETLKNIALFSELSIEQLRKISAFCKIKKFKKNEIIFLENDFYLGFYILVKGAVKIYKTSSSGKEYVVHIIQPVSAFADIPLFDGVNYPVNAMSLKESVALLVPKDSFLSLLKSDPDISFKMLAGFAKRLKSLIAQVEGLTSQEVHIRLAKYLLNEVKLSRTENFSEPFIKLSVPKSTIASYIGTITETLSRTFKKLQDDGIIRVSGKKIFISDYKKLKALTK